MSSQQEMRRELLDGCHYLSRRGFLAGTGGNLSIRVDETSFLITPSGMGYSAMTLADLCLVNLETLAVEEARLKPSVECGLHAMLLRKRPDAVAVVHTHQPLASAVALIGVELPVDEPVDAEVLGPCVPVAGYAPSGTRLLVRALARRIRPDVNAYLLRNHGLVCCGPGMEAALLAAEHVEELARRYLQSAIGASDAGEIKKEALEALQ